MAQKSKRSNNYNTLATALNAHITSMRTTQPTCPAREDHRGEIEDSLYRS